MSRLILLDAGPLGMVSNPKATPLNLACANWLRNLLLGGEQVVVPEIADYEVRRELLRAGKTNGLARLNALKNSLDYLPLTTPIMPQATDFGRKREED